MVAASFHFLQLLVERTVRFEHRNASSCDSLSKYRIFSRWDSPSCLHKILVVKSDIAMFESIETLIIFLGYKFENSILNIIGIRCRRMSIHSSFFMQRKSFLNVRAYIAESDYYNKYSTL